MNKIKSHTLFLPFKANGLELKNRIVMAPMTRSRAIDHLPNDIMEKYYAQRATAGLIISEGISTSPNGLGYSRIPAIFNKEQTEAWKVVTAAVHNNGGQIFAQLNHIGRVGSSLNLPEGAKLMTASAVRADMDIWSDKQGLVKVDMPHAMSITDINNTINEFVTAARNALAAGFDGVEIHSANGYLLEQFLNPAVNIRTDQYGGSLENRSRFVVELVQAVVEAVGPSRIGIRLSPYNTLADMPHYDGLYNSYVYLASQMQHAGILYIHLVDAVTRLSQQGPHLREAIDRLFLEIRATFSGLLIVNGGYTKERAMQAISNSQADLVSFGTAFIANPDLAFRLENDLPLSEPDRTTFYSPTAEGYIDYPSCNSR
jgi:N-ethylmaleimide reductase